MTSAVRRRAATAGLVAAAVTAGTAAALASRPPGGRSRWQRTNFRGRTVDLVGGPAAAAGLLAVALPRTTADGGGAALAVAAAAGLGLYDDLAGGTHARGLRGHLRALRDGEITTGLVKLVGLTGAALIAAGLPRPGGRRGPIDLVVDGALVAGSANLVNLLDLRPGRALKVSLLVAAPVAAGAPAARPLAAAVAGSSASLLPADLGERRMLGDCGANALGAALGWSLTTSARRTPRVAALMTVVGLTLASELVSFSKVIEQQPLLSALDQLGRQRAEPSIA